MKNHRFTLIELLVVISIFALVGILVLKLISGVFSGGVGSVLVKGGFGSPQDLTAKVSRAYVDTSKQDSHYMVVTDKGTFECNNGWWLGVWNCDDIFGKIKENKTYTFKVKGKRVVNWFFQEYPYVVSVSGPIEEPAPAEKSILKKDSQSISNMTPEQLQQYADENGVEIIIKPKAKKVEKE